MAWLTKPTTQNTSPEQRKPLLKTFGEKTPLQLKQEAAQLNSFGGIVKETIKGIPKAIAESKAGVAVQEAAKDIEKGDVLKGITKAAARPAADFAIEVFKPISIAVGAVLRATGGQKLIDKAGNVIADKSGITDNEKFQQFALEHPNAGEDFDRFLNLALLGAAGKSKIEPKRMAQEATKVAQKIIGQTTPTTKQAAKDIATLEKTREAARIREEVKPVSVSPEPVLTERPTIVPPETVGTTTARRSGLSQTVQTDALARQIEVDFGDTPEYKARNMKAAAENAINYIAENPEVSKQVALGKAPPPPGILVGDVFTAYKLKAIKEGDAATIKELASSKSIADYATRLGQEVKAFDSGLRYDPVSAAFEIKKARENALLKGTGGKIKLRTGDIQKAKAELKEPIKQEIKKLTPKVKTWEQFIDSIEC